MQKFLLFFHNPVLKFFLSVFIFFLLLQPAFSQISLDAKGWTVVDTSGHIYSSMLDYHMIYEYHEGAAIAHDGRAWMLIDRYGNRVSQNEYSEIIYAGDDLWICGRNKKYGILNSDGVVVKPPTFDQLFGYGEGKFVFKKGNSYGFTDLKGEVVISPKYNMASGFENGYAVVMKKEKYGLIDHQENLIIPLMYAELLNCREDLMAFSGDGTLFGYIDINNDTIIDPRFTFASSFRFGRAQVASDTVKRRKFILRSDTTRYYINRGGFKAENQRDSITYDTKYNPVEIDSLSWAFISQSDDTLFRNQFYVDQFIRKNNFGNDAGLVAVYIKTSNFKRPDQSGKSAWGPYSLTEYDSGYYKLRFDNLHNSFSILETETGKLIISTGNENEEVINVTYCLRDNRIFFDTVISGHIFFDANELDYQKNIGRHYINSDLSFTVLVDLFMNLFMPMYKYQAVDADWSENKSSGKGLKLERGGALYLGKVSDSLKNGKGKLILPHMDEVLIGNWVNDKKQGQFEIYTAKGDRIAANFTNDLANGEWIYYHGLGKTEKILYENGNEKERIIIRNGAGLSSGVGEIDSYSFKTINSNNEYYSGFIKNNKRFRWGVYQYNDGSAYSGGWLDHLENGFGIFKWADGETYSGNWVNGRQTGKGTNLYPGGSRFDGEFDENQYNGPGIFRYSNGNIIKGNYHNGVVDDTAEITFISGQIEQRVYDYGKLISKEILKSKDRLVGIGISFKYDQRNHDWVVMRVGRKCPADISGLKKEDIIMKVDGVEIDGKKQIEVSDLIKGLAGTIVTINIFRDGVYTDIDVIRDKITRNRIAQK